MCYGSQDTTSQEPQPVVRQLVPESAPPTPVTFLWGLLYRFLAYTLRVSYGIVESSAGPSTFGSLHQTSVTQLLDTESPTCGGGN